MSGRLRALGLAALLLAAVPSAGCGGESSGADEPKTEARGPFSPSRPGAMENLARSVEGQAAGFLAREGTALHRSLGKFLGDRITTKLAKGSAECRPGRETPSIDDPEQYPFACIVEGDAAGGGLSVNISLGFVGLDLGGRCWRAANERVSVTTGLPAQLTRREAMRPLNQIAGCAPGGQLTTP